MEKTNWFAISGRIHGDDEDTGMTFEATSKESAIDQFRRLCSKESALTITPIRTTRIKPKVRADMSTSVPCSRPIPSSTMSHRGPDRADADLNILRRPYGQLLRHMAFQLLQGQRS